MFFDDFVVSKIDLSVHVLKPEGTVSSFENRKHYGLLFVNYGRLHYRHNDTVFLSDRDHVLFVPKGIDYSFHCIEDSCSFVVNFDISNEFECSTIRSFNCPESRSIVQLQSEMEKLWLLKTPSYQLHSLSLFYDILSQLNTLTQENYLPKAKLERIAPSVHYIEYHFNDPNICNEMLAELSHVSTVYFRKLFYELYGLPPMRYVQNLRMEKAKSLLASGYVSVTETAAAVGFTSVYYFSKVFKQMTGIMPSKFREV